MTDRYFARKTGITRLYVVTDRTTGKNVASTGTFASAARKAAQLNTKAGS